MDYRVVLVLLLLLAASPPASATRLVTTTPLVTDLMTQLGKKGDIVAGNVSPSVTKSELPSLGPLFMPSIERTLVFKPDWALSDLLTPPLFLSALTALGLKHLELRLGTVDQLFAESERVFRMIYREESSSALQKYRKCWKEALQQKKAPFRFLALTWFTPPILFGARSFLSDLLTQLGGKNAASDIDFDYPQVSEEWVLLQSVDYVFYLTDESGAESPEAAREVARWWPHQRPRIIALPPQHFALSDFAAWSSFQKLPMFESHVPESCVAL